MIKERKGNSNKKNNDLFPNRVNKSCKGGLLYVKLVN